MEAGRFFGTPSATHIVAGLRFFERRYDTGRSPSHHHECASMCLVLDGGFTEHHARGRFDCAPRSVLFYPPGISHREQFDAPQTRCFIVEVSHAWIARTAESPAWARTGLQLRGGALADLAMRMHRETQAFDRVSPLILEGLMLEFLGTAARHSPHARGRQEERMTRVCDTLHDRFREGLSLEALARDAGVTPAVLARQFRRQYGSTVGTYVRRLRVRYAEQLLTTTMALSEIAVAAGFCDQSHLCRVFRRFTGASPGEFRRGIVRT